MKKRDKNEQWKTTRVLYDKRSNTITFAVFSTSFLPTFLHYLLEYHNLPQDAILILLDKKVKLIKDKENNFIYEEI